MSLLKTTTTFSDIFPNFTFFFLDFLWAFTFNTNVCDNDVKANLGLLNAISRTSCRRGRGYNTSITPVEHQQRWGPSGISLTQSLDFFHSINSMLKWKMKYIKQNQNETYQAKTMLSGQHVKAGVNNSTGQSSCYYLIIARRDLLAFGCEAASARRVFPLIFCILRP